MVNGSDRFCFGGLFQKVGVCLKEILMVYEEDRFGSAVKIDFFVVENNWFLRLK